MSLLALPTELRHKIFSYLTADYKYFSFGDLSVEEISCRPVPTSLQRACRFLYDDTTIYFYYIATMYLSHKSMAITKNPRALIVLSHIKKVDFTMTWRDDEWCMAFDPYTSGHWSMDMAHELEIIRLLNSEAKCLKKLTVSVQSLFYGDVTLEMREERLAQLEKVKEGVTLVAGWVGTYQCTPDEETRLMLEDFVKKLNAKRT